MDVFVLVVVLQILEVTNCELTALSVIGKPAWLSIPHSPEYAAGNSVDGNLATIAQNGVSDPHPVLTIDMEEEVCVGRVTTTLRDSGCGPNPCFIGTVIRAGLSLNFAANHACGLPGTAEQSVPGAVSKFLCDPPRLARYITLDIDPSWPNVTDPTLKIAEVEVEVYAAGECVTSNKPAADTTSAYFRRLHELGSIANPNPLSTKRVPSLIQCAVCCMKLGRCLSFDFTALAGQCRLYNQTSVDIEMTANNDSNIYVRI